MKKIVTCFALLAILVVTAAIGETLAAIHDSLAAIHDISGHASVFTAFSVSNVKLTAPNTYTADKDVVKRGETDPVLHFSTSGLPTHLVIATTDCQHKTKDGERAIILNRWDNKAEESDIILFSNGGTCRVAAIGGHN